MGAAVEQRAGLHQTWAAVAAAWGEHALYVDAQLAPITERMLELTHPQPGERVLELACGAGGLGLAAAERVAPHGHVLLTDVVPEMTRIAAGRAQAHGIANVQTRIIDLETIDEPAGAYDAVLCREGLMFATDPERAATQIRRALSPAGRLAVSVWGPRERNPWLGAVLAAVSAEIGSPVPPPGAPGPFSLADPQRLETMLRTAGFDEVRVEEIAVPRRAASVDEWWERTSALAGPLAMRLRALPPEARDSIRTRVSETVRQYVAADGSVEFPGLALIASGHLPSRPAGG